MVICMLCLHPCVPNLPTNLPWQWRWRSLTSGKHYFLVLSYNYLHIVSASFSAEPAHKPTLTMMLKEPNFWKALYFGISTIICMLCLHPWAPNLPTNPPERWHWRSWTPGTQFPSFQATRTRWRRPRLGGGGWWCAWPQERWTWAACEIRRRCVFVFVCMYECVCVCVLGHPHMLKSVRQFALCSSALCAA